MSIKERIKELCDKQGISMNKLESILGFGKGYCSKLDGVHKPNLNNIQKIADYFNVPLDYLTGRSKTNKNEELGKSIARLNNDKNISEAMVKLSKLQPEDKEMVVNLINSLYDKTKK